MGAPRVYIVYTRARMDTETDRCRVTPRNEALKSVHRDPITSKNRRNIHRENLWRPLDTTSKATLDTRWGRRGGEGRPIYTGYVSVFPGKTNLAERKDSPY